MKLSIFALFGALLGFVGCFIPWGQPEGFHGTGVLIPYVMWDLRDGMMIDYPFPGAFLLNPIIGVLLASLLFGVIRLIFRVKRKPPNDAR